MIAYEQRGAGGPRCIASDLAAVSEMTEEQLLSRHQEALQLAGMKDRNKA